MGFFLLRWIIFSTLAFLFKCEHSGSFQAVRTLSWLFPAASEVCHPRAATTAGFFWAHCLAAHLQLLGHVSPTKVHHGWRWLRIFSFPSSFSAVTCDDVTTENLTQISTYFSACHHNLLFLPLTKCFQPKTENIFWPSECLAYP